MNSEGKITKKNQRAAIIGGGMTGLSLGYLLGQAGYSVTVIEKGKQLSGLLGFIEIEGIPIERFYHQFFTNDNYLLDLMNELGLHDRILWQQSTSACYANGQVLPFSTISDYFKLPLLSLGAKARGALAALALHFQKPEKLPPALTAEQYLRRFFGQQGWEKMWRPLLVNKFGEADSHRLSAQWIAKRIQVRAASSKRGREVFGYINGSYRVLAECLQQAIEQQGGRFILNCEVASLPRSVDGRYQINGEEYDVVVSTIAPDIIKKIVPELALTSVTYRAAICPLFILRSSITPYYWINILDTNVPFSVIVNQQALLPKNYYQGQYPLYVGHYVSESSELFQKSDEELATYYLSYLKRMFPGIESEVVRYEISRTKNAQPVITAPWTPLQHMTNLPNFFTTSMAHIFPEDRGVNYAIREARKISELLQQKGN